LNKTPSGPSGTWAWGAAANLSVHATFVGAYNASQAMTGGNLTTAGAYIVVDESLGVGYAAYAILNVSTPSTGHVYVTLQAAELRVLAVRILASGSFPVAGNYSANSTPNLTPMNVSLAATIQVLDAYRAYVNLTTGPNGSLWLNNEHVQALRGVNLSLVAVNFPNVTATASGGQSIKYTTGAISVRGWVAEDLAANFTPALQIVQGPLHVGKHWTTNSTVRFQGAVAYASAVAVVLPNGVSAQQTQSGGATLNATANVSLTFTVIGVKTVYDANGHPDKDFVIAYTDASGNGGVMMADGLLVLPTMNPTHSGGIAQSVPEHVATAPLSPSSTPLQHSLYSSQRGMVDSQEASPTAGQVVTASPMTPNNARAAMHGLGTPVAPLVGPPGSILGVVVVALGAVAGCAFLVRELRRTRRIL
jgi:hypothetical protein